MELPNILIRPIISDDNNAIATIIRSTLKEFNANHPGTVYHDESTDHLSELFTVEGSFYFVAEAARELIGGAGIYPTPGIPDGVCELVKMYLLPAGRGIGLGKRLIQLCLDTAKSNGYRKVYLETMPELINAVPLYEKLGFKYLETPLGNSGHFGCDIHMIKDL